MNSENCFQTFNLTQILLEFICKDMFFYINFLNLHHNSPARFLKFTMEIKNSTHYDLFPDIHDFHCFKRSRPIV